MAFLRSINNYELSLASFDNFNEWKANIILRNNNDLIVDLRFVDNPAALVSLQQVNQNGPSQIYVHINQFPIYIDILRNEKPLFVQLNDDVSGSFSKCLLRTSREPVGEKELASRTFTINSTFQKPKPKSKKKVK